MSIRWKVALLCIVLAVLPIAFLNSYTVRVFDQFTRKMLEEQMIDYAHVIAADYRRQIESGSVDPDFPARLQHYQRDLLASTTHQLKPPLTAIKGAVQILKGADAASNPAARERFLANIDLSADRLLYMVEQLAVLSSLKAEELRGRKSRVDYGAFVRDVVERLYPAPKVPITLALPDGEITLAIIPERIEQVLANLLDNALRHTLEDGTITVSIRQTTAQRRNRRAG